MKTSFSTASVLAACFLLWIDFVRAVTLPDCQAVAPQQNNLTNVRTATVSVRYNPFGLVYATNEEDIAFVSVDGGGGNNTLGILNTTTFPPTLVGQVALPQEYVKAEGVLGLALTHNGKHVIAAAGVGAIIVDVKRAIAGASNAVVGVLNGTTQSQDAGPDAIEVTLSRDDKYAFVSQEYGSSRNGSTTGNVDVFKLHAPSANGSVSGKAVGYINLGYAVVGTALSPDGKILYAASETSTSNDSTPGFISALDVKTLKTDPSQAVLTNVTAGCGPVRIIVSSDGKTVWVTARESNHLLAFDADKIISNPSEALLASVQVGTAPVGLIFAKNETRILTADSNRFNRNGTTSGLSVVDVQAALQGSDQAVLGRVPTGLFPREFAISPDNSTILVADFSSRQVQAIDVSTLP